MRQSLLKGGFHLFRGRLRGNLGSHIIQVLLKVLGGPAMLALKCAFDDMGKVTLSGHVGGPRL